MDDANCLPDNNGNPVWPLFFKNAVIIQAASEVDYLSSDELTGWCYLLQFVEDLTCWRERGVDFFHWFYVPETRNGKPYISLYDWPHFHKVFTTAVSENGFVGCISLEEVKTSLQSGLTQLTPEFLK